jgi:hypothetical protein
MGYKNSTINRIEHAKKAILTGKTISVSKAFLV